ncbi:fasciclin-like arabinogalactan protein 6 [Wolffia australiana]
MASYLLYSLLSLLLLLLQASALHATIAPPDAVNILTHGKKFTMLINLLNATSLVPTVNSLSTNTKGPGITIFAPTDSAFGKIPAAVLSNLTTVQNKQILLLHGLTKYYNFAQLPKLANPISTLAAGKTLKITGKPKRLFVCSGKVTTAVKGVLYQRFPLSIFPIADVLLP